MKYRLQIATYIVKTVVGCLLFGLGFNLFLEPNGLNAGGISGLAMVFVHLTGVGRVGILTAIVNIPLFAVAGIRIGRSFFVYSLVGMLLSATSIDLLANLPKPETEPLIAALYGGALCGVGMGIVFAGGGSTGGSDIIVRLLKQKWPDMPIGTISTLFDLAVAAVTGFAFWDVDRALYSGVAIFVAGRVIDAVVYRFDYSRVALIITEQSDMIASQITDVLHRGVTFLYGEGAYRHRKTKVILTAVKRQQLAELKQLVVDVDPKAFIIVQEAHQVLGDGFSRYSKDSL